MGERANVVFYEKLPKHTVFNSSDTDVFNYSPVMYTHWGGMEVNEFIDNVEQFYEDNQSPVDNMFDAVPMRREVERVFPIALTIAVNRDMQPQVYNLNDADSYRHKLPTANDMPIIADDNGTTFVNVADFSRHVSYYTWKEQE